MKKLKSKLNAKNSIQIIVKKEEDFVGYIAGFEKLRFLWVSELFVSEKYQKKKVGSKLLNRVIKKSKENKLKGIIAQTEFENIPAQKLYLKNGFTKIKNPLWKDGITFKKNL